MKIILALAMFCSVNMLYAGNAENGKGLYNKIGCTACHNKNGMGKAPTVQKITAAAGPRIAGLTENYIVTQMLAIQGNDPKTERKTKNTPTMKIKIKKLTKQDIEDLAAYVSKVINPSAGPHVGIIK